LTDAIRTYRWASFASVTRPDRPLPMSRAEMAQRGWDQCDVILVTGDAYIDHPSFGAGMIGRFLEWLGCRVGIIAQPRPDAVEDFQKLGAPKLFWGVTAGNVDSQLSQLTVMRKRRRDDPYSPGGVAGPRPPNASIVYASRVRQAAKGVPVVVGGLEASLRRFAYYDYWTDQVRRSILIDSKADILVYGMGEDALAYLVTRARAGEPLSGGPGTLAIQKTLEGLDQPVVLPAYEDVAAKTDDGKRAFAEMTRLIFTHTDPFRGRVLAQSHAGRFVVAQPPAKPLSTAEMDLLYGLPFTNRPHPVYKGQRIPAYDMIRDSVTTHRGCYGECRFCAIAMHQGRSISSRSKDGILASLKKLATDPEFHGTVSDLGGPSANMWGTGCGRGEAGCGRQGRCLYPEVCANLKDDHAPLTDLLRAARKTPGVKHVFVTSGIRFDLALHGGGDPYLDELAGHHVCGRLKIAPEHFSEQVLRRMGKPGAAVYREFMRRFKASAGRSGSRLEVVEYFISGHPGCTLDDMVELAVALKKAGVKPEQVQDFYPAPLTLSAAMFYTGVDPMTGEAVYTARSDREKMLQRALLLCGHPEFRDKAREALLEAGRTDLIGSGPDCLVPSGHR
jgi:uncharacterized radical SAM protein YgiQ